MVDEKKKKTDEGALFTVGEELDKADVIDALPESPDMSSVRSLMACDEAMVLQSAKFCANTFLALQSTQYILVSLEPRCKFLFAAA